MIGRLPMPVKRASQKAKSGEVFWPGTQADENVSRGPVCPRFVSTDHQQTLAMQTGPCASMLPGAAGRSRCRSKAVGSGATKRELREQLLEFVAKRECRCIEICRNLSACNNLSI
jgi:hypothetical protein